jgi:hypothetical protein
MERVWLIGLSGDRIATDVMDAALRANLIRRCVLFHLFRLPFAPAALPTF